MKKFILALVVLVALFLLVAYLFVPSKIIIGKAQNVAARQSTIYRSLTEKELIRKWWPKDQNQKQTILNDSTYHAGSSNFIIEQGLDIITVAIQHGELRLTSLINTIRSQKDSSVIEWSTELATTNNPIIRMILYWKAKQIKGDMDLVFDHLKKFVEKEENVYGLQIQRTKVTDTLLLSAKMQTAVYPQPADYYSLIDKLKTYIANNNVQETNYPMLHIEKQDTGRYQYMVAIPISKGLPDHQIFIVKRMVAGNLLTAEVKGGPATINNAFERFDAFNTDHQYSFPAIPFQLLVTNRLQEQDTSKWITKLCFPVY